VSFEIKNLLLVSFSLLYIYLLFSEINRRTKSRVNAPMIPHALRLQRQTQNGSENQISSDPSVNSTTNMSNNDFRNMLLGNK